MLQQDIQSTNKTLLIDNSSVVPALKLFNPVDDHANRSDDENGLDLCRVKQAAEKADHLYCLAKTVCIKQTTCFNTFYWHRIDVVYAKTLRPRPKPRPSRPRP